jgi:tRNA(fMet)-specific endonuclease VapC
MILLDTDTLTLLFQGHGRVRARLQSAEQDVATTIITRIEILRGRFDAIFKAANAVQLQRAHQRLVDSEYEFATLPIVPIDEPVARQFEKLLANKKLKIIGRGDLLIASIALAHKARLATRNLRDFRQVPGLKTENWADE